MTRAQLPALGYAYVALALPALILGADHRRAAAALFTGAVFAYLWFIASLRAKLVRFDPDGFFASVVVLGGASFLALQAVALFASATEAAAASSGSAGSRPGARRSASTTPKSWARSPSHVPWLTSAAWPSS